MTTRYAVPDLDDQCEVLPRSVFDLREVSDEPEGDETLDIDAEFDGEMVFPEFDQMCEDGSQMPFGSY